MGRAAENKAKHRTIRAIRSGDEARRVREFEKLYLESYDLVYNYVRVRMADEAATEDVVSEAFLHAARAFSSFDPSRAKFSTWVVKIASNCMRDHWRRARPTTTIDDVPERVVAEEGGQSRVDDCDMANRLLTVLTNEERILVAMKYRDGYRNVEIAEELGMNPSTVATKLAKALAKMRAKAESGIG